MDSVPIRVMCVEDNDLVADAIERKLSGLSPFEWLGCASTFEQLMALAESRQPHVVCMDLDMPGQDPFEMVRALRERCSSARVLILSGHTSPEWIDRAIDAGAWGFVSKAESSKAIIEAIRKVANGHFVLSQIAQSEYGPNPPTDRVSDLNPVKPVVTGRAGFWGPLRAALGLPSRSQGEPKA